VVLDDRETAVFASKVGHLNICAVFCSNLLILLIGLLTETALHVSKFVPKFPDSTVAQF
jgi:hypothetical protein